MKRCTSSQINRKKISVQRLMPVRTFRAHHDRNMKSRMLHYVLLDLIIQFYGHFSAKTVFIISLRPGIRTVQPVQGSKSSAVLHLFIKFILQGNSITLSVIDPESIKLLIQLSCFFFQCHFRKQQVSTFSCTFTGIHP